MPTYPTEILDGDTDDGTMPENVADLANAVVGHRIISAEKRAAQDRYYGTECALILTLDNGKQVELVNTDDCCAHTELESFLLHPESVDHIITGIGTTDSYETWHIYADMGDILELKVGWSCGNPFYYGYGFDIRVAPAVIEGEVVTKQKALPVSGEQVAP